MIILLLALVPFANADQCSTVGGAYEVADGRGRFIEIIAEVTQTACDFTVTMGDQQHFGSIIGNDLVSDDNKYSGKLEADGKILWNNGYYWWPQNLPETILPVDCLHPFSLFCYDSCKDCAPCAENGDLEICDQCGRCEQCMDYLPCLEAIEPMPECVESESFECLRECRECTTCAGYNDCLEVTSMVDPMCLTNEAASCFDRCESCIPCALGDETACHDGCNQCGDCLPYVSCKQQADRFPEDKQKCISSDAIHCFNDCADCSRCEDRMYCLDVFENIIIDPVSSTDSPINPPTDATFVTISDYPCATHGRPAESLNQRYVSRGMGANGKEIFQGEQFGEWWIFFDDNCGGDGSHPPAWYLTITPPDFAALENLGGNSNGCTNTMRVLETEETHVEVEHYMCDDGGWRNNFMARGHKIIVEVHTKPQMCCMAHTLECVSCTYGMEPWMFCEQFPNHDLCRPQPPMGGTFVTISDYPCATHGRPMESLNQRYVSRGMGANGKEIFQGEKYEEWWIFFDDNCGGDGSHESAWYVTITPPDFEAVENLGRNTDGCTNTLQVRENEGTRFEVERYMCDDGMWQNNFMQSGHKVIIEVHNTEPRPQPTMGETFVTVADYPCATHGRPTESLNQRYVSRGMGANGKEIFQGEQSGEWWIFFDDNCGGDGSHEPAWYLTITPPDFGAVENLGRNTDGCTNTLQVRESEGTRFEVERYMCDDGMWQNNFMQSGHKVVIEVHNTEPQMCCTAYTVECVSCTHGMEPWMFCEQFPDDDLCRRRPPTDGTFVTIEEYPCATHGRPMESLNQRYVSRGMGANGKEIFQGEQFGEWWIFFDDNCGGDGSHESAWYLTITLPDFGAVENLGGNTDGCTNTMQVRESEGTRFEVGHYMCDDGMWHNSFTESGHKVIIEVHNTEPQMCCRAHTVECVSCTYGIEPWMFCEQFPDHDLCRRRPPTDGTFVTVTDYPCATHGRPMESLNQRYVSRGMGANGKEIFQGEQSGEWWIFFDDNCGGDGSHEPAWYLTITPPDFGAVENLGGNTDGCTNTMQVRGSEGTRFEIEHYMCDDGMWQNSFMESGHKVIIEVHNTEPRPLCSREQFSEWLHRDLGESCTSLFISALSQEHRDVCDCMRGIPEDAASELFGSECYFSESSDRSFMQRWRDCQY